MVSAVDEIKYIQNLKHAVREAALSKQHVKAQEKILDDDDDDSRHFFLPLMGSEDSRRQLCEHQLLFSPLKRSDTKRNVMNNVADDQGHLNYTTPSTTVAFYGIDRPLDQALSPPLLMDVSLFSDTYEDLLGRSLPAIELQFLLHHFIPLDGSPCSFLQHLSLRQKQR